MNDKQLETTVALDLAFSCLIENIKDHQPQLAASLAIDLQHTAAQIPLRLPASAQGAAAVLQKWADVLNSSPRNPADH